VQQRRDKTLPQDGLPERCSVDDVDCYLRVHFGLRDGDALFEQQQQFEREGLVLHWRCAAGPDLGQEGNIPAGSWGPCLRLARDCNSDTQHGPVDFATGRFTAKNDGHVFVQALAVDDYTNKLYNEAQAATNQTVIVYELTLSARAVRMVRWPVPQAKPVSANSIRPDPDFAVLTPRVADPDFAALTPRVQLTVQALDALEEQGMMIGGMPKDELRERVEKQADSLSPGATISPRTLSAAEAFRRQHPK
jgi:hypothetical protein